MSDCSNHKKDVAGITDMGILAEEIVGLHYEAHAELIKQLTVEYRKAANKDYEDGKKQLGENLIEISYRFWQIEPFANRLWQISKPFMESDKQKMMKAKDQKCCVKKCKQQAVAFWPVIDPDIPANPYCRKHLDEAKMRVLAKLNISLQNRK